MDNSINKDIHPEEYKKQQEDKVKKEKEDAEYK